MSKSVFQIDLGNPLSDVHAVQSDVVVTVAPQKLSAPAEPTGLENILSNLSQQLARLNATYQHQAEKLESRALSLAIEITRHLLGADDELIERRLRRCLDLGISLSEHPVDTIYVHPQHVEEIRKILKSRVELSGASVMPDANLGPGDCRLEADEKGLLSRLDSQIETIGRKLLGGMGGGS